MSRDARSCSEYTDRETKSVGAKEEKAMNKLTVSSSPHIKAKETISSIMLDVIIALLQLPLQVYTFLDGVLWRLF